jgi:hypothetical protein
MSGTVLAIISDTHVGSSTALAPLEFTVHNRSDFEAQVTQAHTLTANGHGITDLSRCNSGLA